MKPGVASVIGYALGGLFISFGLVWLLWPVLNARPHSMTDAYVGAGAMFLGALLVAPANLEKAIAALSPVVPWGRRKDDRQEDRPVNADSLPPTGTRRD